MPKKTTGTTEEYIISATLPDQTESYTPIPHGTVINKTRQILEERGLVIERELYRCNGGAKVAQGVYHLKHSGDSDMGMLFAWSNSYDKTMKFKCSIGGFIHESLSAVIGANMSVFDRKHTGTADNEAYEAIKMQFENADVYFNQLVHDKEIMKCIAITDQTRAELLGRIYFIHELLSSEQLNVCKTEFNKPSFTYHSRKDSLWYMYNIIVYALQISHPKTWMDQQRLVHLFLCKEFNITAESIIPVVSDGPVIDHVTVLDPAQMDLEDMIKEVEAEVVIPEKFDAAAAIAESVAKREAEERANELLHGVNNDNAEGHMHTFTEEAGMMPEKLHVIVDKPIATELPTPETISIPSVLNVEDVPSNTNEDDFKWSCLGCSREQGMHAVFHEGQLCSECVENKSA